MRISYPRVIVETKDCFAVELSEGGIIRFVRKGNCTDECWSTGAWTVNGDTVERTCTCHGVQPEYFMEEIGGQWEVNERQGKSVWSLFYGPKDQAEVILAGLINK